MTLSYVKGEGSWETGTLTMLFLDAVDRYGDRPALQRFENDELVAISHAELLHDVRRVGASLRKLGIERGDRVALASENRPEWATVDYGCLCAGIQDVPIYSTLLAHQVAYLVRDSGSRVLFASTREQVDKALEAKPDCPGLEHIVAFDTLDEPVPGVLSWDDFLALGDDEGWSEDQFREEALRARPEEIATLIYTSGTTGEPKGVMLTHGNLFSNVSASKVAIQVGQSAQTLSFLPLSHVLQRMVDYLLFDGGCSIAYARSIQTVPEDIRVVRPTIVVSVPRLYEKIFNRATDASGIKGKLVRWAVSVGEAWADVVLGGRTPGPWLAARYRLANRLVFSKVRAAVGGRIEIFVSGGAPLSPAIAKFFYYCGLPILEGYGLTETSPVTNVNTKSAFRIGTVGKAVPGTEIRIADDGEILIRGPQVMKGYFRKPEDTAAVIDEEGWFRTGDIGQLDDDGFLRITDRKKQLLKTSGGKYVAPQPIENRVKTNPFVDTCLVIGDRRNFPVILIVPDPVVLKGWASSEGIPGDSTVQLLADPRVQARIESEVMGRLTDLASFEKPKKVGVLPDPFTIENGMLTPKQSIKRRVVEDTYAEFIDGFYAEEAKDTVLFVGPSLGG